MFLDMSEIAKGTRSDALVRSKQAISEHEQRNLPKQIFGFSDISDEISETQEHAISFSGAVLDK